ncbi:MAG: TetR/AcrR family transcriptional regulator C-terminal domain-containing protein [Acidimicrobiales bacterium]
MAESNIVEAALRLSVGSSLEDLSMRALAGELGVPVMTLYNYVPSKSALQALVVDHVLRPVGVPSTDEGPWDERMRKLERDARHAVARYPGLSLSRHAVGSSEAARLTEGVLTILADGGFSGHESALAFAALYAVTLGQIEIDAIAAAAGGRVEASLETATLPSQLSREELFEFGLDAVIEGLKVMLAKKPARRRR